MKQTTTGWVEFFKRDLAAAEKLLNDEYCANNVLFHCQQAVEKSFKAVLEEIEKEIPKSHNVFKLYNLIPEEIREKIDIEEDKLNIIDEIYINFRYPSDLGLLPNGFPSQKMAENIFGTTSEITNKVLRYLDNV